MTPIKTEINNFAEETSDKVRQLCGKGLSNYDKMCIIAALDMIKMNMTLWLANDMIKEKVIE